MCSIPVRSRSQSAICGPPVTLAAQISGRSELMDSFLFVRHQLVHQRGQTAAAPTTS